jgi:hypothetical protein
MKRHHGAAPDSITMNETDDVSRRTNDPAARPSPLNNNNNNNKSVRRWAWRQVNLPEQTKGLPFVIRLCLHVDEDNALSIFRRVLSTTASPSGLLNACDQFGCNLLMCSLRCRHYRLFDYLYNEFSSDVNLLDADRQGNRILHYAVVYADADRCVVRRLIDEHVRLQCDVDQRNQFGLTPLLLGSLLSGVTRPDARCLCFQRCSAPGTISC